MLFSALPEVVQEDLRREHAVRQFASGQLIQQRGDDPGGFWLIESGAVAVGQYLASGEFRAVALLGAGDSWGELALFADRPRVVDAVARSACMLRHVGKERFEAALAANPASMRKLLGALSRQLQETLEVVAAIRRGSSKARIAGLLVTLGDGSGDECRIAMSQEELGELLGLTRASVNAGLREFEERGLVRRAYRAIEIRDRDGLVLAALG
ncbi:MAG: Crp/Fnr family transcriptional regulator [Erythrobacter sp.]